MYRYLFLLTFFISCTAICETYTSPDIESHIDRGAVESQDGCINPLWSVSNYRSETKGEIVLYKVPDHHKITVTNLACVTIHSFISRSNNVPVKAVIGLVNSSMTQAALIQWSLKGNYLLLVEMHIEGNAGNGTFISYPDPLARIKEVIINKPFPKIEDLPPNLKGKVTSNTVKASKKDLENLFSRDR